MAEEEIIIPPVEEETVVEEVIPPETSHEEEAGEAVGEEEKLDPVTEALKDIQGKIDKLHNQQGYFQRQLEKSQETKPPETEVPIKVKPREEDFETSGDFFEALTDYKIEQQEVTRQAERARIEHQGKADQFKKRLSDGFQKHEDFEAIAMNPDLPISPPMVEALHDCENAAEIAYHLGQNIDLARDISALSPIAAAREIGKLDAVFSKGLPPPQKTTTKAPTPTKPVGGSETVPKNYDDMGPDDIADFIAVRNRKEFGAGK